MSKPTANQRQDNQLKVAGLLHAKSFLLLQRATFFLSRTSNRFVRRECCLFLGLQIQNISCIGTTMGFFRLDMEPLVSKMLKSFFQLRQIHPPVLQRNTDNHGLSTLRPHLDAECDYMICIAVSTYF
jgi:hypothetical protein